MEFFDVDFFQILPLGEWIADGADWTVRSLVRNATWIFDGLQAPIRAILRFLDQSLNALPWPIVVIAMGLIGWLNAGRGVTDVPTEAQWKERSAKCSPDWPHWYLKLCGKVEWTINSNHPMTVCGDYLPHLKALATVMDIPFECHDHLEPSQL